MIFPTTYYSLKMNVSMSNEVKVGLEKLTEENKAYFWHIRYTALFIFTYGMQ